MNYPMRCGGIVTGDTTRAELLARGFTPEAADEVLAFVKKLGGIYKPVEDRTESEQSAAEHGSPPATET